MTKEKDAAEDPQATEARIAKLNEATENFKIESSRLENLKAVQMMGGKAEISETAEKKEPSDREYAEAALHGTILGAK